MQATEKTFKIQGIRLNLPSPARERREIIRDNRKDQLRFEADIEKFLNILRRAYRLGFTYRAWLQNKTSDLLYTEHYDRENERREAFQDRMEAERVQKRKARAASKPSRTNRDAPKRIPKATSEAG